MLPVGVGVSVTCRCGSVLHVGVGVCGLGHGPLLGCLVSISRMPCFDILLQASCFSPCFWPLALFLASRLVSGLSPCFWPLAFTLMSERRLLNIFSFLLPTKQIGRGDFKGYFCRQCSVGNAQLLLSAMLCRQCSVNSVGNAQSAMLSCNN